MHPTRFSAARVYLIQHLKNVQWPQLRFRKWSVHEMERRGLGGIQRWITTTTTTTAADVLRSLARSPLYRYGHYPHSPSNTVRWRGVTGCTAEPHCLSADHPTASSPASATPTQQSLRGLAFLEHEPQRRQRALQRVAESLSAAPSSSDSASLSPRCPASTPRTAASSTSSASLPWPLSWLWPAAPTLPYALDPFALVQKQLDELMARVHQVVATDHPVLRHAARYFFEVHGKRFRPTVVLLMAQATAGSLAQVTAAQMQLALITELIHTASLLHDDVIDASSTRRSVNSVNALFGNQLAVLAGDFLLARASVALAQLRDCDVVEILSNVIEHLVHGEVLQVGKRWREAEASAAAGLSAASSGASEPPLPPIEEYMRKTWYKTASLLSNSCRAVTLLNAATRHCEALVQAAARYGDHLGLAFQLVDDAMDFAVPAERMGKPALADLRAGTITAPVLLASEGPCAISPAAMQQAVRSGDIAGVLQYVQQGRGVEKTLALATEHADAAATALTGDDTAGARPAIPPSAARHALVALTQQVLHRQK